MGYLQKLLVAGAAMGILAAPGFADTLVGRVITAEGPNSVERDGPAVALVEGSQVFQDDVIYTGADARLEIEWYDSSATTLESNSMIFVRELMQSAEDDKFRLTGNVSTGAQ